MFFQTKEGLNYFVSLFVMDAGKYLICTAQWTNVHFTGALKHVLVKSTNNVILIYLSIYD